jgi:hypothetical protein
MACQQQKKIRPDTAYFVPITAKFGIIYYRHWRIFYLSLGVGWSIILTLLAWGWPQNGEEQSVLTLKDFIDRKRQLECELAANAEQAIARFERDTGAKVERAVVTPITASLSSCTVEVRL